MPNEKHKEFYQDDWAYDRHDDGIMFQFGLPICLRPRADYPNKNVNTVVYMKDILVKNLN